MSPGSSRASLVDLVAAKNGDLGFDFALGAVLGVAFTIVACLIAFSVTWFIAVSLFSMGSSTWIACLGVAVYLAAAFFSALRGEPTEEPGVHGRDEDLLTVASYERQKVAAWAAIILAGPIRLLAARDALRRRLPDDDATLGEAQALLESCRTGLPVGEGEGRALSLLCALALVKGRESAKGRVFVLTERGEAAADA
ncbi:hypothetical protein HY251_12840 [bacterium]|nr:hypothetical protein [bacterium]